MLKPEQVLQSIFSALKKQAKANRADIFYKCLHANVQIEGSSALKQR